jgi:hypothetical protein
MSDKERPKTKRDIFSVMGWILGGLSLLNLVEDLTPLKLLGKLKKWMEAYTQFVETIGNFLFGWIDLWWMSISVQEMHALIIGQVILSAYYRAEVKTEKERGETLIDAVGVSFITCFFWFLLLIVPALFLPSWIGLLGTTAALAFICLAFFSPDEERQVVASRKLIVGELAGVITVFTLLVVLNYTLFS